MDVRNSPGINRGAWRSAVADDAPSVGKEPMILIVDDDDRNLFAMRESLRDIGQVMVARSGAEALKQLLRYDFAVILLDVLMPDMDGYETAAMVRARDRTRHVPIIFLTAVNKDDSHMLHGYAMGAVDYVFKPVEMAVLRSKVSVFVELFRKTEEIRRKAAEEQRLLEENFLVRTEKLLAEQALQRSEERHAAIVRSLPLALYSMNLGENGEVLLSPHFISQSIDEICGFDLGRFRADAQLWLDRVHPEDRDHVIKSFHELPASGSREIEYRWRCADEEYHYFLDQAVLLRDDRNAPVEIVGSLTDVTERRRLEQQLVQAQKMDAIGKLTGGIAHDFNNMLTVVIGCLDRLKRMYKDDPAGLRRVDLALTGALRCSDMTRQLLMFARRQSLKAELIDLNALVGGVGGMVRRLIGDNIELILDCAETPCVAEMDRAQVESALVNLVVNARDAMPNGGTLSVTARRANEADAECLRQAGLHPGNHVALVVKDTGEGMSKEVLGRVFEPFFTTKEPGKGTGLGLSIIYGFVQESGGHIVIDSEVGQGTTVTIYLPASEGDVLEPAAQPEPEETQLQARKGEVVLVVEDDDAVREVAVGTLTELGYRVLPAEDGRSALRLIGQAERIDLVFTDLVMPGGMSGRDLAREIERRQAGLKVLLTSAHIDQLASESAPKPVIGFLHKPYREDELARAVRHAIDMTQA